MTRFLLLALALFLCQASADAGVFRRGGCAGGSCAVPAPVVSGAPESGACSARRGPFRHRDRGRLGSRCHR